MRSRLILAFGVVLTVLVLWTSAAAAASPVTVRDIEGQILCQCQCTKLVKDCDCGTADAMRKEIQTQIDKGLSKKKILAYFVGKYGKPVLGAPTAKGFDITAWVTPFVVMVAAGALLYLILRRWVARHGVLAAEAAAAGEGSAATPGLSEEERAELKSRLDRELKQFLE
ncbi:MAG: cytochrome c-type biogenesis protein [Bacillota bacterium]